MSKGRLEAFSDGVLAIIITIMVLELRIPQGTDLSALQPLLPKFASYLLSFVLVGIYWNNHHHLFQAVHKISGNVLWANLHLLFWLSLLPFSTSWIGESEFAPWPVAAYGLVLLLAAVSYFILVRTLLAIHPSGSALVAAIGNDFKGKLSLLIYAPAIPLAFVASSISIALYVVVAIMWIVPDRRVEQTLSK